MAFRNKTPSFRHEGHMFFIYNHKKKTEEDDPKDAILYFYPRSVSVDDQVALVGGIIGLADFCQEFLPECIPSIVKLAGHNFALLQHEEYIIGLADSPDVPDRFLTSHMNFVWSTFMFYQGSLESLRERVCDNNFLKELSRIWDMYLPLCQIHGDILSQAFHVLPYVQLHKCQGSLFLHASHILQRSLRHKGVIAGALFNKNKVLCSQLSNTLTRQLLLLMSPSQFPCVEANSFLELPGGVRLLYIYLPVEELTQLGHKRSKVYGKKEQSQPVGSHVPIGGDLNTGSQHIRPATFSSDTSSGSEIPRGGRTLSFNRNLELSKPLSPTATIASGTDSEVFLDTLSELNFDSGQQVKLGDIKEVECRPSRLLSPSSSGKSPSDLLPPSTKWQQTGKQDDYTEVETEQNNLGLISSDINLSLSEDVRLRDDVQATSLNKASISPSVVSSYSATGSLPCDTTLVETNLRHDLSTVTNEADVDGSNLSKATTMGACSTASCPIELTTESLPRGEARVISEKQLTSSGEECNLHLNTGLNNPVTELAHNPVTELAHNPVTELAHNPVTEVSDCTVAELPHNPVTELAHNPVTEVSDCTVAELPHNPLTDESNNPLSHVLKNPVTDVSSNPVTDVSSNPVADVSSNPVADVSSNPVADVSSNPVTDVSSNPVTDVSSNPVTDVSSNPVTDVSSNPVADVSSNPVTDVSSNPVTDVSSNPVANFSNDPVTESPNNPVTEVSNKPVADVSSNPVADVSNNLVTEVSNKHVTELSNNPIADISNNPVADVSNNLVADVPKTSDTNHLSNQDCNEEKEKTNLRQTLMRSKEDIDASLEVCFSGEDSSTPSSSTQSWPEPKFSDPQGSMGSLDCAEMSADKDRLTFELAESENSGCGLMSPLSGHLSPVAELSSLSADDVNVKSGLAIESEARMSTESGNRSTHSLSDASSSKNLITKSILQRSGLEEMTLYAQGHSDTLLVLFLSRNTKSGKSYINSLWKNCLPHLAELDFEVKDAERHVKDDNENIGCASQYMRYDSFTQSLKGSALLPVTSLANEIVDSSVRMHQCFTSMPQLQDITYRSHSACCYGHKTVNSETFFQIGLTKSASIYDDKTFKLDQIAQKELLKDRKICML